MSDFKTYAEQILSKMDISEDELKNYDRTFSMSRIAILRYRFEESIRMYHMYPNEQNSIIGLA